VSRKKARGEERMGGSSPLSEGGKNLDDDEGLGGRKGGRETYREAIWFVGSCPAPVGQKGK
jgi:hypothetical protein